MNTPQTKYILSGVSSVITCLIILFLWTKVAKADDLLGDTIPAGKITAKAPASSAPVVAATTVAQTPAPVTEQPKPEARKPAPKPIVEKDSKVDLYLKLDELRSQNAILTEALKNEKLKKDINDTNKGGTYVPGITSTFGGAEQRQSNDTTTSNALQVQMVGGTGDNLYAQISLATGGRQTIHVGSTIAGLGTVQSIALNEVVVANKKQTIILPFASETVTSPNGMR